MVDQPAAGVEHGQHGAVGQVGLAEVGVEGIEAVADYQQGGRAALEGGRVEPAHQPGGGDDLAVRRTGVEIVDHAGPVDAAAGLLGGVHQGLELAGAQAGLGERVAGVVMGAVEAEQVDGGEAVEVGVAFEDVVNAGQGERVGRGGGVLGGEHGAERVEGGDVGDEALDALQQQVEVGALGMGHLGRILAGFILDERTGNEIGAHPGDQQRDDADREQISGERMSHVQAKYALEHRILGFAAAGSNEGGRPQLSVRFRNRNNPFWAKRLWNPPRIDLLPAD